jgi:pimeloyl-ACP methyl ester carboxylesterase
MAEYSAHLIVDGQLLNRRRASADVRMAAVIALPRMWAEQPNWSDAELKAIDTPILVADGDHDEAIKREHTEYIAATIPHAGLLILPDTSHFAFLQDPRQFNFAILHFLGDE